jgi:hypothetical protein
MNQFPVSVQDPYDDPRKAVKWLILPPAIGLLLTGLLSFAVAIFNSINPQIMSNQVKAFKKEIHQSEMPNDSKKYWSNLADYYDKKQPIMNGIYAVLGAVVAIGGFQLMTLSARWFCYIASVISMIPCFTSCCCITGLIFGTWAIIILGFPKVKRAFDFKKQFEANKSAFPGMK